MLLCYLISKMHEDKKIKIINIQYNSLTQCTVEFLHWVIQVILKLFCLKVSLYLFTQFFYYKYNNLWLSPFLLVKVSVDNSPGGSFCWNYAMTLSVAIMQVWSLLQLCRFWCSIAIMLVVLSATLMLVDPFVAVMKVTISVTIMQLEVSCRWYFLQCIMHMTISIVIMQVAVSTVAMHVTALSSKFIFLSDIHFS